MDKVTLTQLGVPEEVADKALEAFQKELEGFIPRTRLNEVTEEKKALETQITEYTNTIEELKKGNKDNEKLQAKITSLESSITDLNTQHAEAMQNLKIDNAIETALLQAQAINAKAVMPFLNREDMKVTSDGSVTGIKEQIEKLVGAEDTAFLFKAQQGGNPGQGLEGFTPKPDGGSTPQTKPQSDWGYQDWANYYDAQNK